MPYSHYRGPSLLALPLSGLILSEHCDHIARVMQDLSATSSSAADKLNQVVEN